MSGGGFPRLELRRGEPPVLINIEPVTDEPVPGIYYELTAHRSAHPQLPCEVLEEPVAQAFADILIKAGAGLLEQGYHSIISVPGCLDYLPTLVMGDDVTLSFSTGFNVWAYRYSMTREEAGIVGEAARVALEQSRVAVAALLNQAA